MLNYMSETMEEEKGINRLRISFLFCFIKEPIVSGLCGIYN